MISSDKFNAQFDRFLKYIYKTSGDSNFRSFSSNETTEEQEGYKYKIYDLARENLDFRNWTEDMIGSRKIHEKSVESIRLRVEGENNNLVDWRLVDRYASGELIKTDTEELEQLLYDLYRDIRDEGEIFAELREVLGSNYSLLAYLYFIKDRRRFLPISTTRFDKGFELLGVDYKSSYQCNWGNYTQYNLLIEEVKFLLMEKGVADVSLLDAHSFLWIISKDLEKEGDDGEGIGIKLWNKKPSIVREDDYRRKVEKQEKATRKISDSELAERLKDIPDKVRRKVVIATAYERNPLVADYARRRANGICELCKEKAPFNKKDGTPFLEIHHIQWLSKGGEDNISNTVALCPNCHRKMHILNLDEDVNYLKALEKKI